MRTIGAVQTYVALLRAVNLGSRNKVSMPDLRALFEALGAGDVETYVQSGTVVFKSAVESPHELTRAIEERIARGLGLDVAVVLRTNAELEQLVARNPFAEAEPDHMKLHVTFLAERPDRERAGALAAQDFAPDELRVSRDDVYLHCPNGYGRSKLRNPSILKQLGVAATTRNWRTVTKLAELARARA